MLIEKPFPAWRVVTTQFTIKMLNADTSGIVNQEGRYVFLNSGERIDLKNGRIDRFHIYAHTTDMGGFTKQVTESFCAYFGESKVPSGNDWFEKTDQSGVIYASGNRIVLRGPITASAPVFRGSMASLEFGGKVSVGKMNPEPLFDQGQRLLFPLWSPIWIWPQYDWRKVVSEKAFVLGAKERMELNTEPALVKFAAVKNGLKASDHLAIVTKNGEFFKVRLTKRFQKLRSFTGLSHYLSRSKCHLLDPIALADGSIVQPFDVSSENDRLTGMTSNFATMIFDAATNKWRLVDGMVPLGTSFGGKFVAFLMAKDRRVCVAAVGK